MYRLILKMAWKNSFLRPARTLLVVVMIAVSMSMMLGIQGLYDGMASNMIDKSKRSASGDITIFAKDYRINRDIKNSIKNATTLREEIKTLQGVEATVLRLSADGLVSTARKSSFASIIGINLEDEEKFGEFSAFLKEGEIDLSKRSAIIGIELAKTLKVR
ncbi:MAG: ABC transporter permease, partial [Campylobacterota bacterium]|nr:ABC transporter permease [Campylobacterota bacterium]